MLFGLIVLWPEQRDVWYLNDASVHRSMVRWASDRLREGHLPFDGWYPYLSLGASRFHHYQSLPHILTGTVSLAGGDGTFRWSLYLLLSFWPVSVFAGGRLLGLRPWPAAAAALMSPLLASAPGLGYEWGSYVWRGSGTWAQLWGMWALPFAWGLGWQAIARGRRLWLAALVLGLTICLHLLTGYLALCCLAVFVVAAPRELVRRLGRAALVVAGALLASAWMLVPLLTDAGWTVNDEFSRGTIYYDSFGARRILTWLGTGGIFDRGRLPAITLLVGVGLVFAFVHARRHEQSRVLIGLGLVSLVLFFGRPTLGPIADLLPGGPDLFLRRFISGVHLAGLYLAGLGAVFAVGWLQRLVGRRGPSRTPAIVVAAVIGVVVLAPAMWERVGFENQGARWIEEQAAAEATDGLGYEALVQRAHALGPGRIFSVLRGTGASRYRIGQVPAYAALLNLQADAIGFTRPTWSLASPAEYRFRIDNPTHPPLFGVRYVIRETGEPPQGAERIASSGRHVLWMLPESDYMQVIDTVAPIAVDRRNIGEQTSSILTSGLPGRRFLPTLAFGGRTAAAATLGRNELPSTSAGEVLESFAGPAEGVFGGRVATDRDDAVVLFAASFDPRWAAFVDGEQAPTQMVAPGLVGVPIDRGRHQVFIAYQPYPHYLRLVLVGILSVAGLALGQWFLRRRSRNAPGLRESP